MVLKIAAAAAAYFPTDYTLHVVTAIVVVILARVISQGRRTSRDRDLHARVILLTGGFTPFGLTLLEALAQRGAHVIALTPYPVESEVVTTYIDLLRSATSNEQIFAETCDLDSPPSIHAFGARFAKNQEQRIDAVIFAHEYRHVGALGKRRNWEQDEMRRETASLATFLLTTLLLPVLLTAPAERDIRIINIVNRFYPAAIPSFASNGSSEAPHSFAFNQGVKPKSTFLAEGIRSLRTVILARHLQRILDALPNSAPLPKPSEQNAAPVPVVRPGTGSQRSNIVALSVSPGLSRAETIAPLLGGNVLGMLFYAIMYPFLLVFAKSAAASIETVLHSLFLPTPFKVMSAEELPRHQSQEREVLKPGALYAECSVAKVPMRVEVETATEAASMEKPVEGKEELKMVEDGELGGEVLGRRVWEAYEMGLKTWNAAHPDPEPQPVETDVDQSRTTT
ncbi:hypothetical protein MIND_01364200 [Mycena indigotica]|uniref:Ketoreductase (KR) domain-containing protein n=1 Tax=Mycena indigotica TaxID=2126181 RepID=A0A8H6RY41_9AGAR|nr:uncharacterized protein MIND_01364200 [Mycena indigotica]KAF7289895.1 hypothetical protein MIND_01364200 [Mycena indigotica]